MAGSKDFYSELGVGRKADTSEIKKAYRRLAREFHPDRNPDDVAAEERFKKVTAAYEVLGDAEKRALYDQYGEAGLREGFDPNRAYAGAAAGGFDFGDFFGGAGGFNVEDLFGGRRRPAKGRDLNAEVNISFVEAIRGCERELTVSSQNSQRKVKVKIPAGIADGGKVRVRGKGQPGRGGPPGDLMLKVRVGEHEHFWREDGGLHVKIPVKPGEAANGGKVRVPTPGGALKVTVPAGSQSGDKLRLRGRGGTDAKGKKVDLIVHLHVRLPEPTDEVKAALEVLDAALPEGLRDDIDL